MLNKVLIDTNVMLRYLLDDDEDMALTAEHVIDGGAWTTPEFIAEVVYVLESIYEFSREDIAAALNIIYVKIDTIPQNVVLRAIQEYEATKLDFVDCMMIAYATESGERVFTFDRGIKKRISELKHPVRCEFADANQL